MIVNRTKSARQQAGGNLGNELFPLLAPRAALFRRSGLRWSIGFALALMMLSSLSILSGCPPGVAVIGLALSGIFSLSVTVPSLSRFAC